MGCDCYKSSQGQAWCYVPDIQNFSTYCERCAGGWRGHWLVGSPCHSLCRHMAYPRYGSSRGGTVQWTGQTQHHSTGMHTFFLEIYTSLLEPVLNIYGAPKGNHILRPGNIICNVTVKHQAICNTLSERCEPSYQTIPHKHS